MNKQQIKVINEFLDIWENSGLIEGINFLSKSYDKHGVYISKMHYSFEDSPIETMAFVGNNKVWT